MTEEKSEESKAITRADIKWMITVGSGLLLTLSSFYHLQNKVDVLSTKVDLMMQAFHIEPNTKSQSFSFQERK